MGMSSEMDAGMEMEEGKVLVHGGIKVRLWVSVSWSIVFEGLDLEANYVHSLGLMGCIHLG